MAMGGYGGAPAMMNGAMGYAGYPPGYMAMGYGEDQQVRVISFFFFPLIHRERATG